MTSSGSRHNKYLSPEKPSEFSSQPQPPDLYTFAQKLPEIAPAHPFHLEWDNLAVLSFESYDDWFERRINRSVRKGVRKAAREGVTVVEVPFDEALVAGIHSIHNETPLRQG